MKKLFRRRKIRKPKRTTFLRMFIPAMILPILLTLFIGRLGISVGENYIKNQCGSQNTTDLANLAKQVEEDHENVNSWYKPIEFGLCIGAFRSVTSDELLNIPYIFATTYDDPYSAAAKWAVDRGGDIVLSNRAKMWIIVREGEEDSSRRYCSCDPSEYDIPELDELFSQYFRDTQEKNIGYMMEIKSLYLSEDNRMIPHEIEVKRYKLPLFPDIDEEGTKDIDTKEIVIDADYEGFELVELVGNHKPDVYPKGGFDGIYGVEPAKFDEIFEEYGGYYRGDGAYDSGMHMVQGNEHVFDFYSRNKVDEDNKYGAASVACVTRMNVMNKHFVKKCRVIIGGIFLFTTLIAFLLCWRRNVKNKAQYAFEDYQRSLINNLAHDLKTPLAVIGGYAENLQELRRDSGSEKELKYISSIMNNVSYTDDIIAKTLQLSENEQMKKLNKTKVDIKALTERLLGKYSAALDERSITLETDLSGEVIADEDVLAAAVENLISNAVKYTRDDGTVTITADRKRLCIVNDVPENVDTEDLLMPFVKGDKARSDKRSHGLGLAIAASAAARSGFTLDIGCKGRKFTATLTF
ncbi:MAG: HAMP domain-containing sensor histidine kinase [Ruminococcus sp.]|nr:HAMP domain-containing sensor histidine kinase [Ruminococcus sp.]